MVQKDLPNLSVKSSEYKEFEGKTKLFVTWRGWTDEYGIPKEMIKKYGKSIIGTLINYRHVDPKETADSFLGKTVDARVLRNGEELEVDTILERDTDFQKKINKMVEDKKLGFSPEIIFTTDKKTGELLKVEFIGGGLTQAPICESCFPKEIKYIAGEKNLSEELAKLEKKLEEKYEKQIKNFEKQIKEQEAVNKTLVAEIEAKKKESEDSDKETEIQKFEQKIKELEESNQKLKTLSLREKIAEIEGKKDEEIEERVKELEIFSEEQLTSIQEMLENALKNVKVKSEIVLPSPPPASATAGVETHEDNLEKVVELCEKNPNLLWNDAYRGKILAQMDLMRDHAKGEA